MAFVYLIGALAFLSIWAILFIWKRELRRPLVFGGILGAPLGISEIFFTDYWIPVFDTIELFPHFYLEDVVFCFALGGISVGVYMLVSTERNPLTTRPWFLVVVPTCIAIAVVDPLGWTFMNYVMIFLAIGAGYIIAVHPARKAIAVSALITNTVYVLVFVTLWYLFPSLGESYLFENLWGITVFKVPLEEYLWAGLFAVLWAPIYETSAPYIYR